MWNIIKGRLKTRIINSIPQLKSAIQEEWARISMDEVRARIAEMPARCQRLTMNSGGAIKSSLW